MDIANLSSGRLINQRLAVNQLSSPKEVVQWMGAMQAQDFNMCKWAVGIRLKQGKLRTVEEAFNKGEIIRTHLLRPTWHLVAAENVNWLLDLSADQIKKGARTRWKQLELTEDLFKKTNGYFEKILTNGEHLTRSCLKEGLEKLNINTQENRLSHILIRAELDKVICSGRLEKNDQTYALFAQRIPQGKSFSREESLATLAEIYFKSHGPATLQDFTWWSGLTISEAKKAVSMVLSSFTKETMDEQEYLFDDSSIFPLDHKNKAFMLPAFDELIVSYKCRAAILNKEDQKKAISNNGIFWPVMLLNGKAIGIWKRKIKNATVSVEKNFFHSINKEENELILKASEHYARFLNDRTLDCP